MFLYTAKITERRDGHLKMRVGIKIAMGFAIVILIQLGMGGTSYYSAGQVQEQVGAMQRANQRVELVSSVDQAFTAAVLESRGYMLYGTDKYAQAAAEQYSLAIKQATALLQVARPEKKAEIEKLIENIKKYQEGIQNQLFPVVRQFHREKNSGAANAAQSKSLEDRQLEIGQTLAPLTEAITKTMNAQVADNRKVTADRLVEAAGTAGTVKTTTLAFSVVGLILVIIISVWQTRMVTKPLLTVVARVDELAQGHFNKDIDQSFLKRSDEFGDMGRAFDRMIRSLRQLISNVSQSAEQLAASSEQLTASAEQSAQASNQVAISVTEMAHGSEKQVTAVNDTSAVVQEISATMEELAATAQDMTTLANDAARATGDGHQAVDQAVGQMKNIGTGAQKAQGAAGDLESGSRQIEVIVGLISSIAGQTNLLALNAAIEAARAGEQGRGFAVVAEEVRKLAEQSEQAAHQIKELIGKNDANIKNVVEVIGATIQEIEQGIHLVSKAGNGFAEIREKVESVTRQVEEISKAIGEIASGSQQIVHSMKEVETVSRDTASEAQTVSAATEEQSASTEEIASASQALAKLATELQGAMSKFRV